MLLTKDEEFTVDSTIEGVKIQMGIAADATAHIMDMLSKGLYSNPEHAIVREYAANALDAHIEAGVDRPIEVTTPTALAPYFQVRDFGTGLTEDDIREIYSQYGASTKRQTNDQVGALGLGCKSAFAYTNAFHVVSVKDGELIKVLVARDEDGAGSMTVQERRKTDEPNGTLVIVPTKQFSNIESEARKIFSFYREGTVLLDRESPKRFDGLKVVDGIYVKDGRECYVVMGNVAYPVEPNRIAGGLNYDKGVVAYVPIGAVSFPASRDALTYNKHTLNTLGKISLALRDGLKLVTQADVDKAGSRLEALEAVWKWQRMASVGDIHNFVYKGEPLPASFKVDIKNPVTMVEREADRQSRFSRPDGIFIKTAAKALWFYGYDRVSFTATSKKKIIQWCDENGYGHVKHFMLLERKPDAKWLNRDLIHPWADVQAIRLPRYAKQGNKSGRIPGSYDFYEVDQGDYTWREGVPGDEIDTTNPVFYTGKGDGLDYLSILGKFHDNYTIVELTPNRIERFRRLFPMAKSDRDEVRSLRDTWLKTVNKRDLKNMAIQDMTSSLIYVKRLDPAHLLDPELRLFVRTLKLDLTKLRKEARLVGGYDASAALDGWKNPLNKYPLWDGWNFQQHPTHMYIYLNAAYEAQGEDD